MTTTTTTITTITPADAAAILAGDTDDVSTDVLRAVLAAAIERGDELPAAIIEALPVAIRITDDGAYVETIEADYGDDYEEMARKAYGEDNEYDSTVTVYWEARNAANELIEKGNYEIAK